MSPKAYYDTYLAKSLVTIIECESYMRLGYDGLLTLLVTSLVVLRLRSLVNNTVSAQGINTHPHQLYQCIVNTCAMGKEEAASWT
jgi:hypothetical protein